MQVCKDIIQRAAGISNLNVEVCTVKQWTMHGQVAERFVGGEDRVFLVGDAAHRFPPAGGFGKFVGCMSSSSITFQCTTTNPGLCGEIGPTDLIPFLLKILWGSQN